MGDFQAINDPKTTLSELEKSAQERIYLKLVEEIERITLSLIHILFWKSYASVELLAQLECNKYVLHQPFNRQIKKI